MGIVKFKDSLIKVKEQVSFQMFKMKELACRAIAAAIVSCFPATTAYADGLTIEKSVSIDANNVDAGKVVNQTLNVICTFGRVAGIFIAVGGVITYIYGYIENNPNSQSRAYPMIAGGIALLGLAQLVNGIFGSAS